MNSALPDSPDSTPSDRRSRSKIARLPKSTRERLNQLLADGLSYPDVLQMMGDETKHVTEMDLSRWMHSGHKLWLKQQAWLDHVTLTFDVAKEMVSENKAFSIHEANLHIAATTLSETMLGTDLTTLPTLLQENPKHFFDILRAVPRFAQQALSFQKYREACAAARAELQKLRDPGRDLTDDERRAIVDKVDEILGLK